jgi:hypothetical protein
MVLPFRVDLKAGSRPDLRIPEDAVHRFAVMEVEVPEE